MDFTPRVGHEVLGPESEKDPFGCSVMGGNEGWWPVVVEMEGCTRISFKEQQMVHPGHGV